MNAIQNAGKYNSQLWMTEVGGTRRHRNYSGLDVRLESPVGGQHCLHYNIA